MSPGGTTNSAVVAATAELRAARQAVARSATQVLGRERAADVELCVSELLTNALEHGWSPARLRAHHLDDAFVVTVVNRSDQLPRAADRPVPPDQPNGRGLQIVQRVADGLAIHREHDNVVVTCRFDTGNTGSR